MITLKKGALPTYWQPTSAIKRVPSLTIEEGVIDTPEEYLPMRYSQLGTVLGTIKGHFRVLQKNLLSGRVDLDIKPNLYESMGELIVFDDFEKIEEALERIEIVGIALSLDFPSFFIELQFRQTLLPP